MSNNVIAGLLWTGVLAFAVYKTYRKFRSDGTIAKDAFTGALFGVLGLLFAVVILGGVAYVILYAGFSFMFPQNWVELRDLDWVRTENGDLVLKDFKIYNGHDQRLKDFVVSCDAKGNSGTTIQTGKATFYEVLQRRASASVKNVNLGHVSDQTKTVTCRVSNASHANAR